ncbi:hypothetical protein K432DRAFT_411408 [Lepidopterella palustris CBS 459.81]|uniref:Uncharacterized protein n=1 Tax=Lepidopterella palustris CBS 459.81 TaxID=1314670 RepID=A0A8E2J7Z2_9PEZI|nr:hypothetical protein K432DRAFT_411408 [Lepidopterella palustris CBS 459.81]
MFTIDFTINIAPILLKDHKRAFSITCYEADEDPDSEDEDEEDEGIKAWVDDMITGLEG